MNLSLPFGGMPWSADRLKSGISIIEKEIYDRARKRIVYSVVIIMMTTAFEPSHGHNDHDWKKQYWAAMQAREKVGPSANCRQLRATESNGKEYKYDCDHKK